MLEKYNFLVHQEAKKHLFFVSVPRFEREKQPIDPRLSSDRVETQIDKKNPPFLNRWITPKACENTDPGPFYLHYIYHKSKLKFTCGPLCFQMCYRNTKIVS